MLTSFVGVHIEEGSWNSGVPIDQIYWSFLLQAKLANILLSFPPRRGSLPLERDDVL
jgi:hypothetical protein